MAANVKAGENNYRRKKFSVIGVVTAAKQMLKSVASAIAWRRFNLKGVKKIGESWWRRGVSGEKRRIGSAVASCAGGAGGSAPPAPHKSSGALQQLKSMALGNKRQKTVA
jgi:hypothetical protein